MKANKSTFREVSIVKFFEPRIMKWHPSMPVVVKDVASNEIFALRENQLTRIPCGKNDKGQDNVLWGYIKERVGRN